MHTLTDRNMQTYTLTHVSILLRNSNDLIKIALLKLEKKNYVYAFIGNRYSVRCINIPSFALSF